MIAKLASRYFTMLSAAGGFPDRTDRLRRHALTTSTNVFARGIGFAVFLASLHVALPYFGSERYGIFAAVAGLVSALTFMDLGIGNGLVTRVAKLRAAGDDDELRRLSGSAFVILAGISALVLLIGLPLVALAPVQVLARNMPPTLVRETRAMLGVLIVLLALSLPANAAARIYFGLQNGYVANIASSIVGLFSFATVVAIPQIGVGMPGLLLAAGGIEPVAGLCLLLLLWRSRRIDVSGFSFRSPRSKSLLRVSRDFAVLQIGGLAGAGADGLIASSLLGAIAVTQYAVCQRIFLLVSMPLHMLNTPLWAAYADADANGDVGFIRRTLVISVALTAGAAAVFGAIVVAWGSTIVGVLTRDAVAVPPSLLIAFAAWTVIDTAGMSFAMYMNGRGIVSPQVYVVVPFAVVSVIARVVVVQGVGVSGLPAASAICYLAIVLIPFFTIFRDRLFPEICA